MSPLLPSPLFGRDLRAVHCAGVGGTGVAPLAMCLAEAGLEVSGEDDGLAPAVRAWLERAGVAVTGRGGLPAACDLLVHSAAIRADHPARRAAEARGIPAVRRGEMLAEMLRGRRLVAVVGAHGKTTTTGMLVTALRRAGFPCGWLLGGLFSGDAVPPGCLGAGEWVVAEIDESDGTIDRFAPEIAVLVSLDWDHPDHYPRIELLEKTFQDLVARARRAVLYDPCCARSVRAIAGAAAPVHSFGPSGAYQGILESESDFSLQLRLGGLFPPMAAAVRARGVFNAHNATAALAAAHLMGAPLAPGLLAEYPGARRRQCILFASPGLTVVEDYAHHPTEIRALLGSLRRRAGAGRLVVVFQPHRFSRTAQFKADFVGALGIADRVFLLDVYPAGEAPVAGGTTADLAAEFRKAGAATEVTHWTGPLEGLAGALPALLRPGDWLAFVGAGDLDQIAHAIADSRKREARAAAWASFAASVRPSLDPATRLALEEPLAPRTTMRAGGCARCFAEPSGLGDLRILLRAAREAGHPVFCLGRGSNLIVPDEGVDGLVVSLGHPAWQACELLPDGSLRAGAGLRLQRLSAFAASEGLEGFEFLEGIPGTVGGALRMNAGAMGSWIFDLVEEVELVTLEGELRRLPRAFLEAGYRRCAELLSAIALGARFRPAGRAAPAEINARMESLRRRRQTTQPREPSAGCVFMNPEGIPAGRLIEELGLKGATAGGAAISSLHANFIINRGSATSGDILSLMRRARARAKGSRGITLQPEVQLLGGDWRDVL